MYLPQLSKNLKYNAVQGTVVRNADYIRLSYLKYSSIKDEKASVDELSLTIKNSDMMEQAQVNTEQSARDLDIADLSGERAWQQGKRRRGERRRELE